MSMCIDHGVYLKGMPVLNQLFCRSSFVQRMSYHVPFSLSVALACNFQSRTRTCSFSPDALATSCLCRSFLCCSSQKKLYRRLFQNSLINYQNTAILSNTQSQLRLQIMKIKAGTQISRRILSPLPPFTHPAIPTVSHICFKGYEPHYDFIQRNRKNGFSQSTQIYCLDKCSIDLALQMICRRKQLLTMMSDTRYQTVTITPQADSLSLQTGSQKDFESVFQDQKDQKLSNSRISSEISQAALYLLKNYRFITKSSFLDVHPFEGYKKLCGYLCIKYRSQELNFFKEVRFSSEIISSSFLLLPLLSQMRHTFLKTQGLKLKQLQRRSQFKASKQICDNYLSKWKNLINFDILSRTKKSFFDDQTKITWAINNNLGEVTSLQDLMRGKYRHYHYASWF